MCVRDPEGLCVCLGGIPIEAPGLVQTQHKKYIITSCMHEIAHDYVCCECVLQGFLWGPAQRLRGLLPLEIVASHQGSKSLDRVASGIAIFGGLVPSTYV